MSVSKCAKCQSSAGKLMGCSKCQLAVYCSRKCQLADWPMHRKTCKGLAPGSCTIRNVGQFEPATKDKNQVVIDNINYIFHELPAECRDTAVAEFIREIKLQRSVHISTGNLFGKSQSYLALVLVYLKGNRFTDAKSAIKRCIETVQAMDLDVESGRVTVDADTIADLKFAIEWNHNAIDSALLKRENDITFDEIGLMLPGALRNQASHSLIKKLFGEQNISLKQENYNQCALIDIRCILLAYEVSQNEDEAESESRATKIVINRIRHLYDLMEKYADEIKDPAKESYELLRESEAFAAYFATVAK